MSDQNKQEDQKKGGWQYGMGLLRKLGQRVGTKKSEPEVDKEEIKRQLLLDVSREVFGEDKEVYEKGIEETVGTVQKYHHEIGKRYGESKKVTALVDAVETYTHYASQKEEFFEASDREGIKAYYESIKTVETLYHEGIGQEDNDLIKSNRERFLRAALESLLLRYKGAEKIKGLDTKEDAQRLHGSINKVRGSVQELAKVCGDHEFGKTINYSLKEMGGQYREMKFLSNSSNSSGVLYVDLMDDMTSMEGCADSLQQYMKFDVGDCKDMIELLGYEKEIWDAYKIERVSHEYFSRKSIYQHYINYAQSNTQLHEEYGKEIEEIGQRFVDIEKVFAEEYESVVKEKKDILALHTMLTDYNEGTEQELKAVLGYYYDYCKNLGKYLEEGLEASQRVLQKSDQQIGSVEKSSLKKNFSRRYNALNNRHSTVYNIVTLDTIRDDDGEDTTYGINMLYYREKMDQGEEGKEDFLEHYLEDYMGSKAYGAGHVIMSIEERIKQLEVAKKIYGEKLWTLQKSAERLVGIATHMNEWQGEINEVSSRCYRISLAKSNMIEERILGFTGNYNMHYLARRTTGNGEWLGWGRILDVNAHVDTPTESYQELLDEDLAKYVVQGILTENDCKSNEGWDTVKNILAGYAWDLHEKLVKYYADEGVVKETNEYGQYIRIKEKTNQAMMHCSYDVDQLVTHLTYKLEGKIIHEDTKGRLYEMPLYEAGVLGNKLSYYEVVDYIERGIIRNLREITEKYYTLSQRKSNENK